MSNDKVVALRSDRATEPRGPNAECIEHLEALLERARTGEVQGVVIASVTDHNLIETSWTDSTRCIQAAAAVSLLFHRFMDAWNRSPD